jgi:hypothetical protein
MTTTKDLEQAPFPEVMPMTLADARALAPSLMAENDGLRCAVEAIQTQDVLGVLVLMAYLRERIRDIRSNGE